MLTFSCAGGGAAGKAGVRNAVPYHELSLAERQLVDAAIALLKTDKVNAPEVFQIRKESYNLALNAFLAQSPQGHDFPFAVQKNGTLLIFPLFAPDSTKDVTANPSEMSIATAGGDIRSKTTPDSTKKHLAEASLKFVLTNDLSAEKIFSEALFGLVYEPLVKIPETGAAKFLLAEKIEMLQHGSIWRISLRDDISFSNGTPLTSENLKSGWENDWQKNKAKNFRARWILQNIEGFQTFSLGETSTISGLRIIDDRTLEIALIKPMPRFREYLAQPCFAVRMPAENSAFDLGTGLFYFREKKSVNHAGDLHCFANPHYSGEHSKMKELNVQRLRNADLLDVVAASENAFTLVLSPKDLAFFGRVEHLSIEPFPVQPIYFLRLNAQRRSLFQPTFRLAVLSALQRSSLTRIITTAKTREATTFLGEFHFTEIHEQAPLNWRGKRPLELIYRANDETARQIAERLDARLTQLKIPHFTPVALTEAEFETKTQNSDFDILIDAFSPVFQNQIDNAASFANAFLGAEVSTYFADHDGGDLSAKLRNFEKALFDDLRIYPLVKVTSYAVFPKKLKNPRLLGSGRFDLSEAWISR